MLSYLLFPNVEMENIYSIQSFSVIVCAFKRTKCAEDKQPYRRHNGPRITLLLSLDLTLGTLRRKIEKLPPSS